MDPTKGLTLPTAAKSRSRKKIRRPKGLPRLTFLPNTSSPRLTFLPNTSSPSAAAAMPLPAPEDNIFKSPTSEGCEKIYITQKELATGDNARIYLSNNVCPTPTEPTYCREFAVKVLYNLHVRELRDKFRKEVLYQKMAAALGISPNIIDSWICKVTKGIQDHYTGYIVMDYLEGNVIENIDFSEPEHKHYKTELDKLINKLHRHVRILHNDLHLKNIMRLNDGRFMIIDFGEAEKNIKYFKTGDPSEEQNDRRIIFFEGKASMNSSDNY